MKTKKFLVVLVLVINLMMTTATDVGLTLNVPVNLYHKYSTTAAAHVGSLAYAGDFNNDGHGDYIYGDPTATNTGALAGCAYVIFGPLTYPAAGTSLTQATLAAATGMKICAVAANTWFGASVSYAGDQNHDGIADIVVGAVNNAYVIWGSSTIADILDIETAVTGSTTKGVKIVSSTTLPGTSLAESVSVAGVGDTDGDRLHDLVIGRVGTGAAIAGVILLRGKSTVSNWDIQSGTYDGYAIVDVAGTFGKKVSSAGDFDGDGYMDFMASKTAAGAGSGVYLFYGKTKVAASDPLADLADATLLTGKRGFSIIAGAGFGGTLALAGNLNHDKYSDVIIGIAAGSAAVTIVYGRTKPTTFAHIDISATPFLANDHFQITEVGGALGVCASGLGDVSGDGVDDVLVGTGGSAWVVYGNTVNAPASFATSTINSLKGFQISPGTGIAAADSADFGTFCAFADINRDGASDPIVGGTQTIYAVLTTSANILTAAVLSIGLIFGLVLAV